MKRRSVDMKAVASIAGVSSMSVSRALRDPSSVSPQMLARINEAIAEAGYVPHQVAGALKSGRTFTVGCIIPGLSVPVFADLVDGLSSGLREAGYRLILSSSQYTREGERGAVEGMLAYRPQGIVITGVMHDEGLPHMLTRAGIPVVEVWDWTESPIDMLVGFSNEQALFDLTRGVMAGGRRNVAFLSTGHESNSRVVARERGYRRAAAGKIEPIVAHVPPTAEGGTSGFGMLLGRHPRLDAIICANDLMAIGVMVAARNAGMTVPDDLAVAGFADFEISRYWSPSLTTVRVPRYNIGQRAAEMILARVNDQPLTDSVVDVGYQIIWRESAPGPADSDAPAWR